MRKDVRGTFDHSRFYHTGALGSGLAVFSRYPIIESHALPYSLSGLPLEVIAGDFFVNKAAALAVIQHPILGEVEIWNTHMHAGGEGSEVQQSHRMAQAWQLASEIRRAGNRWVFCVSSLQYALISDGRLQLSALHHSHSPPPQLRRAARLVPRDPPERQRWPSGWTSTRVSTRGTRHHLRLANQLVLCRQAHSPKHSSARRKAPRLHLLPRPR